MFHSQFQTAQSNFYSRQLFDDSPSSSLQRSSYNQRQQEQRYLLQAQLEQELLQHQIHRRYLESQHRYSLLQQQNQPHHRSDYEQLQSSSNPQSSSHKYHSYIEPYERNNHRLLSSTATHPNQSHLNNNSVRDILNKQINYNFNNVNNYYNNTKITAPLPLPSASSHLTKATAVKPAKTIDYNSCNNNTINKSKPYQNNNNNARNSTSNINNNNNHNDTYIEYLQKPIKMQREEIIIEQSQLVRNGNEQTNGTNAVHRTNHYTQVSSVITISSAQPIDYFIFCSYSSFDATSLRSGQWWFSICNVHTSA